MNRSDVLLIAGKPQQSGWPEKIAETWEDKGLIFHHRLFISYSGNGAQYENVQSVTEGIWLRGYGWLHPRKE